MALAAKGKWWLVAGGAGALLVGCGPADAPETELGTVQSAVVGGTMDDTDTHVAFVFHDSSGCQGSGVLVAPHLLLTSIMCVGEPTVTPEGCLEGGAAEPTSHIRVSNATDATSSVDFWPVADVFLPPEGECKRDLALLSLDPPINGTEATPTAPRLDEAVSTGETYAVVGYGSTAMGVTDFGLRRRRDGLTVQCVDDGCGTHDGGFWTIWSGEGICQGDGGTPALDDGGEVTGLGSMTDPTCSMGYFTHVYHFADWLRQAARTASNDLGQPVPSWATGTGGAGATGGSGGAAGSGGTGGAGATGGSGGTAGSGGSGGSAGAPGAQPMDDDDGCSCTAVGAPRTGYAPWALITLLATLLWRRRRP